MVNRGRPPEGAYIARHPRGATLHIPFEMRSLIERRTRPFLDSVGIERPIAWLLQEAYLQGLRDAVEAMDSKTATEPSQ